MPTTMGVEGGGQGGNCLHFRAKVEEISGKTEGISGKMEGISGKIEGISGKIERNFGQN